VNTSLQPHRLTAGHVMRFIFAFGALICALTVVSGVIVASTGIGLTPPRTPGKVAKSGQYVSGKKGFSHCGDPGYPACPPAPYTWVAVVSESPPDVIAALKAAPDFMSPVVAASAQADSSYTFDAPVLVLPATTGGGALPHLIVRAAIQGVRYVTYDLDYDRAHHLIRISGIGIQVPSDPNYNKPFPWLQVTAQQATATLQQQGRIALATSSAPELVYFTPPDIVPGTQFTWTGGGTSPANPMWRLKGTDGHYHFVGVDGHLYQYNQLPVAPGTTVIQS
jgi:hypothetical protein